MRDTIQELAAISGSTSTATSGISVNQGNSWLKEIVLAAKQRMYFEQFATVVDVKEGNVDVSIPINSSNKSFSDDTTQTSRTYTALDNLTVVTFTPAEHKYGVAISAKTIRTTQVDVLAFARDQLAYDMALDIDTAIGAAIAAEASPAASLYGGDATSTATLAAGDVFSTDLVAGARRRLLANGWVPEPDRPFVIFIPAAAEEALMRDSQFVNASEYGSNEVVMNGEIGKYLGMKVIVTEQCPSSSTYGAGGNLAGHTCFVLKAKVAYAIAWGLRPTLDWEYKKEFQAYQVYMDCDYVSDSLHGNAIVLIYVVDA